MKKDFMQYVKNGVYTGPAIWEGSLSVSVNEELISLGSLTEVIGFLNLYGSKKLENLGLLKKVSGSLGLTNCVCLKSLGGLEYVGSSLDLDVCTSLADIGALKRVGTFLYLRNTPSLQTLWGLEHVLCSITLNRLEILRECASLEFEAVFVGEYRSSEGIRYSYAEFKEKVQKIEKAPLMHLARMLNEVPNAFKPFVAHRLRGGF